MSYVLSLRSTFSLNLSIEEGWFAIVITKQNGMEKDVYLFFYFGFRGRLPSVTSATSEGAQGFFSKITFLKSVHSKMCIVERSIMC